ncbi:MAG: phosphoribosylglycinamide formyltransferase 2 [Polyangiaceae bacterium]
MFLGSGELGKEVVIELQRLGVEVIAVDRYADAPGQQVAHRAHVIDMTNGAALRELVLKERPHLVVPEIEAIATDELVKLEAEGLAKVIPTANAAHTTMNRERIRRLAVEAGLPSSRHAFCSSLEELEAAVDGGIGVPCFVKPVMSSSGKGQSKIKDRSQVKLAWEYALAAGRVKQTRVIVEAEVEFDFEITLLTVRHAGGTAFCEPVGHVQIDGDYVESWQPQPMTPAALEKARGMAREITDRLGGWGIFGVELFVKGDQVWFSEVSPRPHDTGLVTLVSQHQSEFALHARAILGLPVDTSLRTPGASAVVYGGLEQKGIAFEGVAEALAVPGTELRLFGKPESFKKRRMGVALARADSVELARERAKLAAAAVRPVAP